MSHIGAAGSSNASSGNRRCVGIRNDELHLPGKTATVLFGPLRRAGWYIKFPHNTFGWPSEASGKAAVHCVIVEFTRQHSVKPRLIDRITPVSSPIEIPVKEVNAYLVDGPWVLVDRRSSVLSAVLTPCDFGSRESPVLYWLKDSNPPSSAAMPPLRLRIQTLPNRLLPPERKKREKQCLKLAHQRRPQCRAIAPSNSGGSHETRSQWSHQRCRCPSGHALIMGDARPQGRASQERSRLVPGRSRCSLRLTSASPGECAQKVRRQVNPLNHFAELFPY